MAQIVPQLEGPDADSYGKPTKVDRGEREMAIIRASCPDCGDVELTSRDVTVRVNSTTNEGTYAFQCPECQLAVCKSAEPRIIDLLVSSGVELYVWTVPAELYEEHLGAPLNYDDLLTFHYEIQQEGWFDKVVASAKNRDLVSGGEELS